MIALLPKKLRALADMIEEVLTFAGATIRPHTKTNETPAVAAKIRAKLVTGKRPYKGKRTYKGTHWTQDPKNRERVMALARKRAAKRGGA